MRWDSDYDSPAEEECPDCLECEDGGPCRMCALSEAHALISLLIGNHFNTEKKHFPYPPPLQIAAPRA